jgi:hypothetical protein
MPNAVALSGMRSRRVSADRVRTVGVGTSLKKSRTLFPAWLVAEFTWGAYGKRGDNLGISGGMPYPARSMNAADLCSLAAAVVIGDGPVQALVLIKVCGRHDLTGG